MLGQMDKTKLDYLDIYALKLNIPEKDDRKALLCLALKLEL